MESEGRQAGRLYHWLQLKHISDMVINSPFTYQMSRAATAIVYLSDAAKGGATYFPRATGKSRFIESHDIPGQALLVGYRHMHGD